MHVLAFAGRTGTVSMTMWVSSPMITAEDRACLVILPDQSCPGATSGPACRWRDGKPWPSRPGRKSSPEIGGSVEVEDGAAGPLRLRRGEVDHRRGDLVRPRHPVERALRPDRVPLRARQEAGGHVGLHVP